MIDGPQFKQARINLGYSITDMAEELDVNRSTIFRMEARGGSRILELAMERLAQIIESEK